MGLQVSEQKTWGGPRETSHSALLWAVCVGWRRGGRLQTSAVPPWTLWCSCLLTFWGLEWLTLPGMRHGILLVSMVVLRYIYWRSYCVFQHLARSPWQPNRACSGVNPTAFLSPLLSHALRDLTFATCPATPHPAPAHAFVQVFPACSQTLACLIALMNPSSSGFGVNPLWSLPPIFPQLVALFFSMTSWTSIRTLILFFSNYLFALLSMQTASPLRAQWTA